MNRVALGAGAFRTTILFQAGAWRTEQLAVTGSYERRISPRMTLSFSGGGLVAGSLYTDSERVQLLGGGLLGAALSYVIVQQSGAVPFVVFSGSFSAAVAQTERTLYAAFDVRVGVAAGYTLFERFSPYLTARAFGGPVFWNQTAGGDATHVQLGGGLSVRLPAALDLFVEAIPLGEQRITAGLGLSL